MRSSNSSQVHLSTSIPAWIHSNMCSHYRGRDPECLSNRAHICLGSDVTVNLDAIFVHAKRTPGRARMSTSRQRLDFDLADDS